MKRYILLVFIYLGVNSCIVPPAPSLYGYSNINNNSKHPLKVSSSCVNRRYKDLWGRMTIVNDNTKPLILQKKNIHIQSNDIKYSDVSIFRRVNNNIKYYNVNDTILISAQQKINLELYFTPVDKEIHESAFRKIWENDTLKISIQLDVENYEYIFVSDKN